MNSSKTKFSTQQNQRKQALQKAFPHTLPIMAGFLFLGMTLGILMRTSGLPIWFPMLCSCVIYAGSAEFVTASLLLAPLHPLQTFLIIFMLNARHLFYGISMLEKYRDIHGRKKFFLIYGLSDETFSINCSVTVPHGIDHTAFYESVTWLDRLYWFSGCTIGALAGSFFPFPTKGLDFVMTAMFVVILLEQLQKKENIPSAVIGIAASLLSLLLFGADRFMLPAMLCILVCLAVGQKPLDAYYQRHAPVQALTPDHPSGNTANTETAKNSENEKGGDAE